MGCSNGPHRFVVSSLRFLGSWGPSRRHECLLMPAGRYPVPIAHLVNTHARIETGLRLSGVSDVWCSCRHRGPYDAVNPRSARQKHLGLLPVSGFESYLYPSTHDGGSSLFLSSILSPPGPLANLHRHLCQALPSDPPPQAKNQQPCTCLVSAICIPLNPSALNLPRSSCFAPSIPS